VKSNREQLAVQAKLEDFGFDDLDMVNWPSSPQKANGVIKSENREHERQSERCWRLTRKAKDQRKDQVLGIELSSSQEEKCSGAEPKR
jgi:hypothetical protein